MLPLTYRPAEVADLLGVRGLLRDLRLPVAGVEDGLAGFIICEAGGDLVATAGLEVYGTSALLRSVAVRPLVRRSGVAQSLVGQLLDRARQSGIGTVYLLTTTAESYFAKLGFSVVDREVVPEAVRQSVEFREACPASAAAMRRSLKSSL